MTTEETSEAAVGGEIPRYRLLQKSPMDRGDGYLQVFEPGTIFESRAIPGVHWEPLNEEAATALNLWLDESFDVLDKDFQPTGKRTTRRAILQMPNSPIRMAQTAEDAPLPIESRIIAVPDRLKSGGMEYAQARFTQATPYSAPPPEAVPDAPRLLEVAPPPPRAHGKPPIPAVRRA